MRKIFVFIGIHLMILCSSLFAIIVEIPHFNEINHYIGPNTLVILDIDNTLLAPLQMLGSDVWFLYRLKYLENKGIPQTDAIERALAEWEAIQHMTKVKIVEEGTDKIIQQWQDKKVRIMGLATQGVTLAARTIKQLLSLNINLSKTAPSAEDYYLINQHGILYTQGILFTAGTPKGSALVKLLDKMNYHPQHVVFINDKAAHLQDVEAALKARNIPFIGLRYSYSDKRVKAFRPEIADIQWKLSSFEHILSDNEAQALLSSSLYYDFSSSALP